MDIAFLRNSSAIKHIVHHLWRLGLENYVAKSVQNEQIIYTRNIQFLVQHQKNV